MTTRRIFTTIIMFAALLLSCESNTREPFTPDILTSLEAFEYELQDVANLSGVLHYRWQNAATSATVVHNSAIRGGTAKLLIYAADDSKVYEGTLDTSATMATSSGAAGLWTITLSLSACTGTLDFTVNSGE